MYVLDFLKGFPDLKEQDVVAFEYRLLCSGELYNASVQTSDWRKSTVSRILCDDRIRLLVVSSPFEEFPQEMALRFSAPQVTEQHGNSTSIFHPDDDIARDIAAILSVLFRRLVTVAAKTREVHPKKYEQDIDFLLDWPSPFVNSLTPIHWQYKPSTVIYRPDRPPEITNYNPHPLGISFNQLKQTLRGLPSIPFAESLVLSARLYALALTQIHHDVDLAFQLLIAAVEATASEVFGNYRPTDDQMIAAKESVAALAHKFGLGDGEARQLALEACKGIPWASRKFSKFLLDNCTEVLWGEDDVFRIPAEFVPSRDELEGALGRIYSARGKLTHGGRSFPASSAIGIGPTVPAKAIMGIDWTMKPFPPVPWFERVVNNALNGFINRSLESETRKTPESDERGA